MDVKINIHTCTCTIKSADLFHSNVPETRVTASGHGRGAHDVEQRAATLTRSLVHLLAEGGGGTGGGGGEGTRDPFGE